MSIANNVARIRERIAAAAARAGRRAEEITLVAVSKTFSAGCIRKAYDAGVRHFGENRVQEWGTKAAQLSDLRDATWHLVGHLQSNKARRAVELFSSIDSVDSAALAQRLDRLVAYGLGPHEQRASGQQQSQNLSAESAETLRPRRRLPILIEVRLAPEETKHGVEPADLPVVVEAVRALPHLDLRGLLCIPPWCENPDDARPYFRRLVSVSDALGREGRELGASTRIAGELSMGMSHDFEVAIEEGATQVRIGTAIFGAREKR